jgi:peroxiredoxin
LRDNYPEFEERNAEILVLARDTLDNARGYFEQNELPFPCLPDPDAEVYRLYDVKSAVISLGQRPGLFVIDGEGTVRYSYLGWQQWEIPSVEETLEVLDNLQ